MASTTDIRNDVSNRPSGPSTILQVEPGWAPYPQVFRVLLAAARGVACDVDLAEPLTCCYLTALGEESRGNNDRARALLKLEHEVLRTRPELRAPYRRIDEFEARYVQDAVASFADYERQKMREDPAYLPSQHSPWRPPRLRIPRAGIPYRCEACGEHARVASGRARIVRPVLWAPHWILEDKITIKGGSHGECYALIVCCEKCRRRELKRCHDEQYDGFEGCWQRCSELAIGSRYCALHRSAEAERERGAYDRRERPNAGRGQTPHPNTRARPATAEQIEEYMPVRENQRELILTVMRMPSLGCLSGSRDLDIGGDDVLVMRR